MPVLHGILGTGRLALRRSLAGGQAQRPVGADLSASRRCVTTRERWATIRAESACLSSHLRGQPVQLPTERYGRAHGVAARRSCQVGTVAAPLAVTTNCAPRPGGLSEEKDHACTENYRDPVQRDPGSHSGHAHQRRTVERECHGPGRVTRRDADAEHQLTRGHHLRDASNRWLGTQSLPPGASARSAPRRRLPRVLGQHRRRQLQRRLDRGRVREQDLRHGVRPGQQGRQRGVVRRAERRHARDALGPIKATARPSTSRSRATPGSGPNLFDGSTPVGSFELQSGSSIGKPTNVGAEIPSSRAASVDSGPDSGSGDNCRWIIDSKTVSGADFTTIDADRRSSGRSRSREAATGVPQPPATGRVHAGVPGRGFARLRHLQRGHAGRWHGQHLRRHGHPAPERRRRPDHGTAGALRRAPLRPLVQRQHRGVPQAADHRPGDGAVLPRGVTDPSRPARRTRCPRPGSTGRTASRRSPSRTARPGSSPRSEAARATCRRSTSPT